MDTEKQPTSPEVKTPPSPTETKPTGVEVKPVEGAGKVEGETPPTTPPLRTYSEEEWNTRQSSIDKQTTKVQGEHQVAVEKIQANYENLLTQQQAQQATAFLKQVEDAGGDMTAAKAVVELQGRLQQRERELGKKETDFTAQQTQVFEGLKRLDANRLATQYGIDEKPLFEATNLVEMENIALKLSIEKGKTEQKPVVQTDTGVPSAKGVDLSAMSLQQRVAWALEHEKRPIATP